VADALAASWSRFWAGTESRANLSAARVLLALAALWVLLSRFDLPSLLNLPPEMWQGVTFARRVRFLLVLPVLVERLLYALLHVSLLVAIGGWMPRLACLASGLLLYHFAPLEALIRTPNPYLRGFTIPALGLLILSFVPSQETPRWPLRLVQVLFCQIYLFAGYSKLVTSGMAWATVDNIRNYLLILNQIFFDRPEASLGYWVAAHPALCAAMAWAGLAIEFAFPAVLFFPRSRWVLLPAAFFFHAANAVLFRIFFQSAILLLLFVDWGAISARRPR
jgi:hypothetical protein